jgi:hypothetical protein
MVSAQAKRRYGYYQETRRNEDLGTASLLVWVMDLKRFLVLPLPPYLAISCRYSSDARVSQPSRLFSKGRLKVNEQSIVEQELVNDE